MMIIVMKIDDDNYDDCDKLNHTKHDQAHQNVGYITKSEPSIGTCWSICLRFGEEFVLGERMLKNEFKQNPLCRSRVM